MTNWGWMPWQLLHPHLYQKPESFVRNIGVAVVALFSVTSRPSDVGKGLIELRLCHLKRGVWHDEAN